MSIFPHSSKILAGKLTLVWETKSSLTLLLTILKMHYYEKRKNKNGDSL